MILASQLRAGMAISYEGQDYKVVAAEYHPGQGRMGGATHARLRNLDTGTFWEHSFRSELRLEEVPLEKRVLEFLYADEDQCCFMDPESFEQTEVPRIIVGPQAGFLEPGMKLAIEFVKGRPDSRAQLATVVRTYGVAQDLELLAVVGFQQIDHEPMAHADTIGQCLALLRQEDAAIGAGGRESRAFQA